MYNRFVTFLLVILFRILDGLKRRPKASVPPPEAVRRVLLVSTTGLGDTIMATPTLAAARTLWPRAEIRALLHVRWLDLLTASPHLDGIIPYPGKFKGLRRLIRDLRSFRPDLAVIVHANDPDILPLCWLSGAGTIIGPAVSRFSFLVDVVVPPADPRTPYVERYLAGVRAAAGFPVPAGPEILFLPKERTDWADEFWAREGLGTGEPLVVMNPGGSHESKRWPDDYWRELIRLLGQADGPRLALFGSNAERPLLEDLARTAIHKTAWVVTRPQVVDAAALLTRASVLVGPDSGLAHMAYGLGVPAVIFFGPDDPALSGPYQPRGPAMVLVRDKSVCPQVPGCRKKVCRPNRCLLAITPDEVTRAVRKYL